MKYFCLVLFYASLVLSAPSKKQRIFYEFAQEPIVLKKNETNKVRINITLLPEHHAYLDMLKVEWLSPEGIQVSEPTVDPIVEFDDPFTKTLKATMKDSAEMILFVLVDDDVKNGDFKAKIQFQHQICDKENCYFPKKVVQEIDLKIVGSSESLLPVESQEKGLFQDIQKKGLFIALLLAFLGGILTSFTPCIFPMIPITLAILGSRSKDTPALQRFLFSLLYVLGIALTYTALGLIAASTGSLFGAALSNPIIVGGIAAIFFLMALSMFGLFEIRPPRWVEEKLGRQGGRGYFGALIMGLVAGIVASPCVGPVLAGILTHVAKSQDLFYGATLLFSFAMGFGLLFLVLGASSELFNKLPKSGSWMDLTKYIFGTTMLLLSVYYLDPLLPGYTSYFLAGIVMVTVSMIFGKLLRPNKEKGDRIRKAVMGAFFVFGIALIGQAYILQTQLNQAPPKEGLKWEAYSKQKQETALQLSQITILYFTADWCLACKELKAFTFNDPRVLQYQNKLSYLIIDATEINETEDALIQEYNVVGLPTLVFLDKNGKELEDLRMTGFESADRFLERLKKLAP